MPTTALTIGPSHTLTQNEVYALPARTSYIFSNAALEISNDVAFGASQAVSADTPTLATGLFVRCTVSEAIVKLSAL